MVTYTRCATHCAGESNRSIEHSPAKAGSDHPAVAVRSRRNKGNVLMVEELTVAKTYKYCSRANGARTSGAAVSGTLEESQPNLRRYRASNGRAGGISKTFG